MQPPPPPSLDSLFQHRQSRLSSLPEELQTEIKGQVRDHRARELSEQIVRAETEYAYPLFLSLVTRFIRETDQDELNPDAFYDPHYTSSMRVINKTCLQFVEIRCMRIVSTMHRLVDPRFPDSVPLELNLIRELMIQLAIRKNNKNKQVLRTLRGNSSSVEELIYSIERVADLSCTVIKTSIRSDATPLSEAALALSDECCDQFIIIVDNDNAPELKEQAKQLLFQMLRKLNSTSQDRNNLSESIRAMVRIMHDKIKQQPWWPQYARDHGYQQGGKISKSFKKQSKYRPNRRASKRRNNKNNNSRHKKNKNKKKGYVYVLINN